MTDDAEMAELNREWRGGNGATNVLSFPGDHGGPGSFLLGDVVLAFETIVAEATEANISTGGSSNPSSGAWRASFIGLRPPDRR